MKKSFESRKKQQYPENGARLYRAIDGIDEKWIALADDPSVTFARSSHERKRCTHRHTSSRLAAICAIFLLLFVAADLLSAAAVYRAPLTVSETFALEYSELYSDALIDERHAELLAYREEVTLFLKQYDKVTKAALTGKIALADYRAYMERYHYLEPRALSLDRFVAYTEYLRGTESQTGAKVQILYRSAWERFFERDRFPLLVAALFVTASFVAILARRYGFSKRKRVASAFALGASVSIVLSLAELLIFFVLCRPEGITESIVSLERFSALPPTLTMWGYLALRILLTALLTSAVTVLLTSLIGCLPKLRPAPKETQLSERSFI